MWDKLYSMKAAFIPQVNDELDTQNFEKFEEVATEKIEFFFTIAILYIREFFIMQSNDRTQTSAKSGPWRRVSMLSFIIKFFQSGEWSVVI